MKKTILLTIAAMMALSMSAKSLVLTLADGTEVYFLLGGEKDPVMKISKETVTVDTKSFTFTDVVKFHISQTDDPNAIQKITAGSTRFDGTTLFVSSTDKSVQVYTVDGKKVNVKSSQSDGMTMIPVANLESGIYVLRVGNQSMKFIKK